MKTSDILNKAADLIEERGWGSGKGWCDDGQSPVCLEGAITAAGGEYSPGFNDCQAARAVRDHLGLAPVPQHPWCDYNRPTVEWVLPGAPLYVWNDQPRRTQAEVVEVLRATAVIEAARETQPAGAVR